jgi:hypothetical protein
MISDYQPQNRTQLLISHWFYLFSTPPHWGDNRVLR